MGHDIGIGRLCFVDDRPDLGFAVLGVGDRICRRGYTARRHYLDLGGPLLQLLSDCEPYVVDAIDYPGDGTSAEATGTGLVGQQRASGPKVTVPSRL